MKTVGVIGLGDMGSGLAANCLKAGFETHGFDLSAERLARFVSLGGHAAGSARQVGENADAVFVMVLNGDQARTAILGGRPGAEGGTLTLMAAAPHAVIEDNREILEAVGGNIFHIGEAIGMGQTLKACLQGWMGSVFAATFEAAVLAARSGLDKEGFAEVAGASFASNPATNASLQFIMDRAFVDTGSHIGTMYKDLTVTMDHARDMGVPMFMAGSAMQLFQAGITKFPGEDNWTVAKILEDIVGVEVRR